ncbi:FKBP-type peptidyl-prolyl cis-trans isomerase [Candidatus Rubidus massiliensis]|nr:FKBP-type peptidyl-prolyl cis-trans isomerase [Candidatus Rubidus massiliensis]
MTNLINTFILASFLIINNFQLMFAETQLSPARVICDHIKKTVDVPVDNYMNAFIEGIIAYDEKVAIDLRLIDVERAKISLDNLEASEKWLQKMAKTDGCQIIIPQKLFYKVLKEGNGKSVSIENGNIIANYYLSYLDSFFPFCSEVKGDLDLSQVIPGMAHGILNMQEGEIREIYIHPCYVYGNSNYFEPNKALKITIELLNVLPKKTNIPPLEAYSFESSLISSKEYEEIMTKNSFCKGCKLWDYLRFGYKMFDKEEIIDCLRKKEPLLEDSFELDNYVNQIHWKIYHQKIVDEYKNADSFLDNLTKQTNIFCIEKGFIYCTTSLNTNLQNKNNIKIKWEIKNKEGKILQKERVEVISTDLAMKGLAKSLNYLVPNQPSTLYIHPSLAYPDVDSILGDTLLVVNLTIIEE